MRRGNAMAAGPSIDVSGWREEQLVSSGDALGPLIPVVCLTAGMAGSGWRRGKQWT